MKENELTYELICAAVKGEEEALNPILRYYDDYITTLAPVEAEYEYGQPHYYIDHDLKVRIQRQMV